MFKKKVKAKPEYENDCIDTSCQKKYEKKKIKMKKNLNSGNFF